MATKPKPSDQPPLLEWVTAGLGLMVVLSVIGVLAWQAVRGGDAPAEVSVRALDLTESPAGWRLRVEAANAGERTAAEVQIEGRAGEAVSGVVIPYVPGHGRSEAVLVFAARPEPDSLELGVVGWVEP